MFSYIKKNDVSYIVVNFIPIPRFIPIPFRVLSPFRSAIPFRVLSPFRSAIPFRVLSPFRSAFPFRVLSPFRSAFYPHSVPLFRSAFYPHSVPLFRSAFYPHSVPLFRSVPPFRHSGSAFYPNPVFSCVNVARTFNLPDVSVVFPINVAKLASWPSKVEYILNGFRHGFWQGFHSNTITLKSAKANCPSSAEQPAIIDKYLAKEVSLGRVAGPFQAPALSNLQISRFGVIPKKDGGWRLILDLSFPFGHSVNDGINKEDFTVTYSKVSDAIALIVKARRGALMGKVDINSAYRIIPVHPSDRHLLGMFWRDCYYIDLTLSFGLRSAPAIFNTVADSFHWCAVNNWNVPDLLHYLDDYFTLGPSNSNICASRLKPVTRMLVTLVFHCLPTNAWALLPVWCFWVLN